MHTRIEEKFTISFWDIFYNPYYIIRSRLYKAVENNVERMHGSLLDFGCGSKPYEHLFAHVTDYKGVDFKGGGNNYKNTKIDVYYDGTTLPFDDGKFDNALATEVMEHVFNPEQILSELNRVLKPGGKLLITCPFNWPEHEQPWDYARYSSFGIKYLLEKNGFEIIHQEKTGSFFLCIIQMIVLYFYMLIPKIPVVLQLFFFIFCFPFYLIGLSLHAILPLNIARQDMYLNNIVLAKKLPKNA